MAHAAVGLRLILDWDSEARRDGFSIALIPGPPAVQRVFALTHTLVHLGSSPRDRGRPACVQPAAVALVASFAALLGLLLDAATSRDASASREDEQFEAPTTQPAASAALCLPVCSPACTAGLIGTRTRQITYLPR